jgi:uncharacterized protein YjlB
MNINIEKFELHDDGTFPNSKLPALLYEGALDIPVLFPATYVKNLFAHHNWTNSWDSGIFEFHHYHSVTHEVLGMYSGSATLQLGGQNGPRITVKKGDVLIIPAGVAHKNLGHEDSVGCVGAYPDGRNFDMNYGRRGERPAADENIKQVPVPVTDPVWGLANGIPKIWY